LLPSVEEVVVLLLRARSKKLRTTANSARGARWSCDRAPNP
jgi:hypothetical protein